MAMAVAVVVVVAVMVMVAVVRGGGGGDGDNCGNGVCIACSLRHTMDAIAMQGEPSRCVGTQVGVCSF